LIIVVPLAMDPSINYGFVVTKLVSLQVLTIIGLSALVISRVIGALNIDRPRIPKSLAFVVTLLTAWLLLTSLVAFDRERSWLGSIEWRNGLRTKLMLLGMAWLVFSTTSLPHAPKQLLAALIWTSTPIALYGLLQAIGFDPIDWYYTTFVFSTLGNANHLAAYLAMIAPLTLAYLFTHARGLMSSWAAIVLLGAQLVTMIMTKSRGGLLAVALGLGLILLWRWRRPTEAALKWFVIGAVLSLLGTFAIASSGDTIYLGTDGTEPRPAVWLTATNAIFARPLTGWGLASFEFAHGPHASSVFREHIVSTGNLWDRTHNIWLEWGVELGLPGIILSAMMLFAVLRIGFHAASGTSLHRWTILGCVAALLTAFIQQLLNTSSLGTETVFWWIVGLTVGLSTLPTLLQPTPLEAP